MSPAERQYWLAAQRRVSSLQTDVQAAVLRAFRILRDSISEQELAQIIASGALAAVLDEVLKQATLDRAFLGYRQTVRNVIAKGFTFATKDLPKAGKVDGTIAVAFDHLTPEVVEAIRTLETKVITTLQADIRETVRTTVERGIRDGLNPRAIARELRDVIGLSPTQEGYVYNLRVELESGRYADAARRVLLDQRFNLAKLDTLSPAARAKRIDTIVENYRKSFVAFNAETNARTATLDAYKQGQRLAWEDAIAKGVVDADRLVKSWKGVMDDRERPEHVAMQDETVPFDEPYSNGEMTPGESTYNCRCVSIVRVLRANETAGAAAARQQPTGTLTGAA